MKSYSMQSTTEHAAMELRELAMPEPGPRQLLVRMRAASLNRGEFIVGHGLQKAGTSKAIGMEGSGEVAKLGPDVTGWSIGQRVMGRCAGAFAEYALMDLREAIALPPDLSFEEAAAVPPPVLVGPGKAVGQGKLPNGGWLPVA